MNDKNRNSILLSAIFITALLMAAVHFIPDQKLTLFPDADGRFYLTIRHLPNGELSSQWANDEHTAFTCRNPEGLDTSYFPCGFTIDLNQGVGNGINLSRYSHVNLHINYEGSANKLRIAMRNFNPIYSTPKDHNSTKFNAIHLHAKELNRELSLPLSSFTVADWWLLNYNIPFELSAQEINNVVAFTIDFDNTITSGDHYFEINKVEFQGQRISPEYWYLGILVVWMLGIFLYAIARLIQLHKQTQYDVEIINQLSNTNEELVKETNKFRHLSTVDPLTQLYNRFGIDQVVGSLSGANPNHTESSITYTVLIIDLDHFKQINDRLGHAAGDLVLQHVSNVIRSNIRSEDYVGRWGGEEFLIIMPNASKELGLAMAEYIRHALAREPSPISDEVITASFGVSQRASNEDFASCFKRADDALYQAKARGRNCSVVAADPTTNQPA